MSNKRIFTLLSLAAAVCVTSFAGGLSNSRFDLTNFRYKIDSRSVFHNSQAAKTKAMDERIGQKPGAFMAQESENPTPEFTLAPAGSAGDIDAPDGQLWYYTGNFEYIEIPPHGDVYFTDRILQEYTFDIYDADMNLIGTIKDKMDYQAHEVRVPMCELAPIATRSFFNTDDKVEVIVSLAVNIEGGGNNYRSVVYSLNGEKDAEGYDVPVTVMDDLVGDVVEGPVTDGIDNFYITFVTDVYDQIAPDATFWEYLLSQKAKITVYGRALDNSGPRSLFSTVIPIIQFPGDQENVSALMSMRKGDEVVFSISYYKEPFYNQYDDPFSEEMTQREGNSLVVDLYKASLNGLEKFSTTEIPVSLDPMNDSSGNPTCLFSFFSVGSLRYTNDILFDAPGATADKPDFIVTRGNYQVSTDDIINSYFTYTNSGVLKNTIFEYADGMTELGNLEGFEPQQMFVSADAYGYIYNFVDLYSGKTVAVVPADFYVDDDSDAQLLTTNVARYADDSTYKYVFEMRYPITDDNGNDIIRFMYLTNKGAYDHIDYVNMGQGVAYAQSYLATEALGAHAYSTSATPAYMMLVKRSVSDTEVYNEELMVAEAMTTDNPDGKVLLQLGPKGDFVLSGIVPEFARDDNPGHLFVYYYNSTASLYLLDIYHLPLDEEHGGVDAVTADGTITINGGVVMAEGAINVYALSGVLTASGHDTLSLSSLEPGIYVVSAQGKTVKIIKK